MYFWNEEKHISNNILSIIYPATRLGRDVRNEFTYWSLHTGKSASQYRFNMPISYVLLVTNVGSLLLSRPHFSIAIQ